MWQWIFFWRRQQSPNADAAKSVAELSPRTEPELSGMPEERSNEMKARWKNTRTLMVVHSNTARAVEAQYVEDDPEPEPKPVLVLPIEAGTLSQSEAATTKPEEDEDSATGKGDASDLVTRGRINYFTHGCYAVAGLGGPRLTVPYLMRNRRRARFLRALPDQNSTAATKPGSAQGRSPAAQK
jgi:hypothetical protein